jgi:hypothetical protein
MSDIAAYLETIKLKLVTSRVIADYQIVKERTTFPYHVHQGSEENVISGEALSICQMLDLVADAVFGEEG